jgi:hypothetical protein
MAASTKKGKAQDARCVSQLITATLACQVKSVTQSNTGCVQ